MPKFSDSSYQILKDYFDVIKATRTDDDDSYILGKKKTIVAEGGIYTKLYQENENGDFVGHRFIIQDINGNNFRFQYTGLESTHSAATALEVGEKMWFRKDSFFHDWLVNNPNASVNYEDFINVNKSYIYFGDILQITDQTSVYNIEFKGLKDWVMDALPENNRTDRLTDFMKVYWDQVYHVIYNQTKELWSLIDPKEVKIDHLDYLARRANITTDKDKVGGLILREWVDQLLYWLKRKGTYTSYIAVYKMMLGGTRNKLNIFEKWCEWCLFELRHADNKLFDRDFDEHHIIEHYSHDAGLPSGGSGPEYYEQFQVSDYPTHATEPPNALASGGCFATRYFCGDLVDFVNEEWNVVDEQTALTYDSYSLVVDGFNTGLDDSSDISIYDNVSVSGANNNNELRHCFRVYVDSTARPSGGLAIWGMSDSATEEFSAGERNVNREWVALTSETHGRLPASASVVFRLVESVPSGANVVATTVPFAKDETYHVVVEKKDDILYANFFDTPSNKSTELAEQISLSLRGAHVGKADWNYLYALQTIREAATMPSASWVGEVSYLRESASQLQTLGPTGYKVISPHIRVELDLSTEPMGEDFIISQDQAEELVRYWEYLKPVSKFVDYNWLISPIGVVDDESEAIPLYAVDNTAFLDTQFVGQAFVSAGTPTSASKGPDGDYYENIYKENRLVASDDWTTFHGLGSDELIIQTYDRYSQQAWPINHIFLNENRVAIDWVGNKRGKTLIAGLKPWNYSHFQSEPASAWNITHNMGTSGASGVCFEIVSISGSQGIDVSEVDFLDTHFNMGSLDSWHTYFGPSAWTVSGGWTYNSAKNIYTVSSTSGRSFAALSPLSWANTGWGVSNTEGLRTDKVRLTFSVSGEALPSASWVLNGDPTAYTYRELYAGDDMHRNIDTRDQGATGAEAAILHINGVDHYISDDDHANGDSCTYIVNNNRNNPGYTIGFSGIPQGAAPVGSYNVTSDSQSSSAAIQSTFEGITLNQGETITTAYLKYYITGGQTDDEPAYCQIRARDVAVGERGPTGFGGGGAPAGEDWMHQICYGYVGDQGVHYLPYGKNGPAGLWLPPSGGTTATVNWTMSATAGEDQQGWTVSPDISTIIQELVDRPDWPDGISNKVTMFIYARNSADVRAESTSAAIQWNEIAVSEPNAESGEIILTADTTDWWYDRPGDINNLRFEIRPALTNTSGASAGDYYFAEAGQNNGFGLLPVTAGSYFDYVPDYNYFTDLGKAVDGDRSTYATTNPAQESGTLQHTVTIASDDLLYQGRSDDLADFPVKIYLSDKCGKNGVNMGRVFTKIGSNYNKFRVYDENDTNLWCEVEHWDATTSGATVWARIPNITAGVDKVLTLEFDPNKDNNPRIGLTGSSQAANVWDKDFAYVYHMNQTPVSGTACILNSVVASGGDLTPYTYRATQEDQRNFETYNLREGLADYPSGGYALKFHGDRPYDAIGQLETNSAFSPLNENQINIEAFFRIDEVPAGTEDDWIMTGVHTDGLNVVYGMYIDDVNESVTGQVWVNGAAEAVGSPGVTTKGPGNWIYTNFKWADDGIGQGAGIMLNTNNGDKGYQITSGGTPRNGIIDRGSTDLIIGGMNQGTAYPQRRINGLIGETRYSRIARNNTYGIATAKTLEDRLLTFETIPDADITLSFYSSAAVFSGKITSGASDYLDLTSGLVIDNEANFSQPTSWLRSNSVSGHFMEQDDDSRLVWDFGEKGIGDFEIWIDIFFATDNWQSSFPTNGGLGAPPYTGSEITLAMVSDRLNTPYVNAAIYNEGLKWGIHRTAFNDSATHVHDFDQWTVGYDNRVFSPATHPYLKLVRSGSTISLTPYSSPDRTGGVAGSSVISNQPDKKRYLTLFSTFGYPPDDFDYARVGIKNVRLISGEFSPSASPSVTWFPGGYSDLPIDTVQVKLNAGGSSDAEWTPWFTASASGDTRTYPSGGTPQLYDITTDTNAPSPWTWADVETLRAKFDFTPGASADYFNVSRGDVIVTYTGSELTKLLDGNNTTFVSGGPSSNASIMISGATVSAGGFPNGDPDQVAIRVHGKIISGGPGGEINFIPYFGATSGSKIDARNYFTSTADYTPWIRIDNDPQAPSPWTETDVDDFSLYVDFKPGASDGTLALSEADLRLLNVYDDRITTTVDYQLRNIEFYVTAPSANRVTFTGMKRKAQSYVKLPDRGLEDDFEFWFDFEITSAGYGNYLEGGRAALFTVSDYPVNDITTMQRVPSGAVSLQAASLSGSTYLLLADYGPSGESYTKWNVGNTAYGTDTSINRLYTKFNRWTGYGETNQPAITVEYYPDADRVPSQLIKRQVHFLTQTASLGADNHVYFLNAVGAFPSGAGGFGSDMTSGGFDTADTSASFYFDDYDTNESWVIGASNMVDGDPDTYAETSLDDSQLLNSNTATDLGSDIFTVKMRAKGFAGHPPQSWYLEPWFSGDAPSDPEDFTSWTEVDPGSDISVTSSRITFTAMDESQEAYLYKDFGNGYFGDGLEIEYAIRVTAETGDSAGFFFGLTQDTVGSATTLDTANDGLGHRAIEGAANLIENQVNDYSTAQNSNVTSTSVVAVTYYYTMTLNAGVLQITRWTDSSRTVVFDNAPTISSVDEGPYRYLVFGNIGTGTSDTITGYLEDFTIVSRGATTRTQYDLKSRMSLSDQNVEVSGTDGGTRYWTILGVKPGKPHRANGGQGVYNSGAYFHTYDADGNLWLQCRTSGWANKVNTQEKNIQSGMVYKNFGQSAWIDKIYEPSGAINTWIDFNWNKGKPAGTNDDNWYFGDIFYNELTGRMGHVAFESGTSNIKIAEFSETGVDYPNQYTYEKILDVTGGPSSTLRGCAHDPVNDNYIISDGTNMYVIDGTAGTVLRQRAVRRPSGTYNGNWGLTVSGGVLFQQADYATSTPWIYACDPLTLTASTTVQPSAVNYTFRGTGYAYGGLAHNPVTKNFSVGTSTGTRFYALRKWSSDNVVTGTFSDYSEWIDITNDPNAPETWTWQDVIDLDVKNFYEESDDSGEDEVQVSIVELQVGHLAATQTNTETVTGYFSGTDGFGGSVSGINNTVDGDRDTSAIWSAGTDFVNLDELRPIQSPPTPASGSWPPSDTIETVEIRLKGFDATTGYNRLIPYYNGGADAGDTIDVDGVSDSWTSWVDITNDTNAPGSGNWTQDDIVNMYAKFETQPAGPEFFRTHQIEVRITSQIGSGYVSPNPPYNNPSWDGYIIEQYNDNTEWIPNKGNLWTWATTGWASQGATDTYSTSGWQPLNAVGGWNTNYRPVRFRMDFGGENFEKIRIKDTLNNTLVSASNYQSGENLVFNNWYNADLDVLQVSGSSGPWDITNMEFITSGSYVSTITGDVHDFNQRYDDPPSVIIPAKAIQVTPNDLKLVFAEAIDGRAFIRDDDYFHQQTVASTTWDIQHNLNSFGQIVQCYDHNREWVFPEEITLDGRNRTICTFAQPVSGEAVFITFASDINLDNTTALFGDPNLGTKGYWKIGDGGDNPYFDPKLNNDINSILTSGSGLTQTETTTAASGTILINFEVPENGAYTINEFGVYDRNQDLHYYSRCSTLYKPDGVALHVRYRIRKE